MKPTFSLVHAPTMYFGRVDLQGSISIDAICLQPHEFNKQHAQHTIHILIHVRGCNKSKYDMLKLLNNNKKNHLLSIITSLSYNIP